MCNNVRDASSEVPKFMLVYAEFISDSAGQCRARQSTQDTIATNTWHMNLYNIRPLFKALIDESKAWYIQLRTCNIESTTQWREALGSVTEQQTRACRAHCNIMTCCAPQCKAPSMHELNNNFIFMTR